MQSSSVYHYTRLETAMEKILTNKCLRMGPLKNTNDPRENSRWRLSVFGSGDGPPDMDLAWQAAHPDPNSTLRRGVLVTCFCEDYAGTEFEPATEGFARPRMWAQYGGNHRGVCLAIDRSSFEKKICNAKKDDEEHLVGAVRYAGLRDESGRHGISHEEIGYAHSIDMDDVNRYGMDAALLKHRSVFSQELFFTKHRDWRDEWEYRCLIFSMNRDFIDVDIEDALLEVVLGVDFPGVYQACLIRLCSTLGVRVSQIRWHNGLRAQKADLV